ncbi:hypothetical protein GOV04_02435, partial [Candidatus Woesearchaeota archaeon]|nr:hypothetical protein [Candidatus Woesearchaeota archaeon]
MKKQLFISLILVVLFSTITFAIDYAPDNYDFRIWQGDYNTITTSIEGWAVRCDTTISNENHDQTNGYVCNKNVGTVASPSYCAVEGNIYSQLRIYHSSDANVAPNQYVYSICPSDSQTSCTGYSTSSSVSGILVYTVDWDGQQGHCENANCAPGFAYPSSYDWSIGGEVASTTCCGDDTGERVQTCTDSSGQGACGGDTTACCTLTTDCIDDAGACQDTAACYGVGVFGNSYCSAGSWEDPDEGSGYCVASCDVTGGDGGIAWNPGGEGAGATACCGDDAGEYRDIETQGSDAPALFDDSSDACCDTTTDCTEASICYTTGQVTGSIPNRGYCSSGSWLGGDASQTACDNIVGVNYWNIGGEVDPTACCTDDTGENKELEV